jgi:hypothetical protein
VRSATFAKASWTQALPDWIDAHVRAFEAIRGVPELVVPDNAKTAVVKASFYDPQPPKPTKEVLRGPPSLLCWRSGGRRAARLWRARAGWRNTSGCLPGGRTFRLRLHPSDQPLTPERRKTRLVQGVDVFAQAVQDADAALDAWAERLGVACGRNVIFLCGRRNTENERKNPNAEVMHRTSLG